MQIKTNDIHIVMFDAAFPLPVVGGKEKQAFILFNQLRNIGVSAKVLSYSFADHNEDSDVYRVPKGSIIRIVYFLFKMRKTANILHVHTPSRIGIITCIIGKFFLYKTMFKFPNEGLFSETSSKIFFKIFLEYIVDEIIILEKGTEKELSKFSKLRSKLNLFNNGVHIAKQKSYIDSKNLKLLFIGRLVGQKGCIYLTEIAKELKKLNINFQLDIYGRGEEENILKSIITEQSLNNEVHLKGETSSSIEIMYNYDIVLLPSMKEGMSNVILEAMSIGLPVISTKVGALEIQLGDYYQIYGCDLNDITNGFVEKISLFSQNNKLLEEYGHYLHERCKNEFSIESITSKYLCKYQDMNSR